MLRQIYLVFYLFKGGSNFFKNFSFKLAFDKAESFLTVVTVFCGRRIFIKQTHRVNSKNLRMPLTLNQIRTFNDSENLEYMLDDLVSKKYLTLEHPKRKIDGRREQDKSLPLGYNIVAGKMSFRINKILNPNELAPTLVAMDTERLYVADGGGLRNLSLREGLRIFGYPEDFKFDIGKGDGFDLLGNTVVVPVIKYVSEKVLDTIYGV